MPSIPLKVEYSMDDVNKGSAADLIVSILLIIFGTVVIYASLNMRVYKTFLDAPGFFPLLLGIIFVFLGSLMLLLALRRKGIDQIKLLFTRDRMVGFFRHEQFSRVMILIGMMAIYIFGLLGRMHFAIATTLYLFATFWYLKSTSLVKNLLISVITAVAISLVFTQLFHIPLP